MMWDDECDVVCCGSGVGVLACAIAAADAELDVLLAHPGIDDRHDAAAPLLGPGIEDPETREYFDALSADVGSLPPRPNDVELTVRAVRAPAPARPGSPIAPFYGARLRDWAVECLLSPYGVLYTRLTDRETKAMQTPSGEDIEVKVIGSVTVTPGDGAVSALDEWLTGQTRVRDIPIQENSTLERIVFEEDEIVGVVLATPEGPRAVRVRHGIAVAGRHDGPARGALPVDEPDRTYQVGLVGHSASRFARVELLTTDLTAGPGGSEYCTSNPARDGGRSHVRHWRKADRNPPLG